MSEEANIRLNKVLRKLNISTNTAVQLLENYGHSIVPKPTTKVTHEQFQILITHSKGFRPKKRIDSGLKIEKKKITTINSNTLGHRPKKSKIKSIRKIKQALKLTNNSKEELKKDLKSKTDKNNSRKEKKGAKTKKGNKKIITRKRPEVAELLLKLENICVGQRLKKIPIVLGIPEADILKLGRIAMPNCTLESRISQTDFDYLKPTISIYLKELLNIIPETVEIEKNKKNRKYKPTMYTETSKYYDFVRIIYTNM